MHPEAARSAEAIGNALPDGLKVLHVLDHSLPLHAGYSFRTASILHAQRKQGLEPVAVTSPKHEESWKKETPPVETIEDVRYYRTGLVPPSPIPLAYEMKLMGALERRIREVARIERPDLIHAHSPILCAVPALRVGRALGLPVVYEVRAFWEDAAVDHGTDRAGSIRYRTVRGVETWACKSADHVVVICGGMKDELLGRGIPSDKIDISWNAIDPGSFQPGEPDRAFAREHGLEGKRVLGFLGSFYGYEGLELLVSAMGALRGRREDLKLLLVGGGPREQALRDQIRREGLEQVVVMPGRIAKERIPGLYGLVDILVYPRYSTRLTELVTPLKPLEAMAMGKPLVASDIGGHRELIQDRRTGLLFSPGSVPSLVSAVETILDDDALRADLVRGGREWVETNRAWSITTSVYSKVYTQARLRAERRGRDSWKRNSQGEAAEAR
ncbi:MAG TPA: TIGR04063 family PEP-CTERM/XrtA system glycosyltransferase [Candidatus Eisenbacteria bacterium]|nr:TIGR04063 family PEP-CTERM/XrtA system glycosyltransferase [Candidatus Eisenbacteria bacterium]